MSSNVWQCMESYCKARQCSQWVYVPLSFHNGPLHPDLTGLQRSRGKKKYGRKQTLITLHWKINQLLKVEYNRDIRFPIVLFVPYQVEEERKTLKSTLDVDLNLSQHLMSTSQVNISCQHLMSIFQLDFPFLMPSISQYLEFNIYDCYSLVHLVWPNREELISRPFMGLSKIRLLL